MVVAVDEPGATGRQAPTPAPKPPPRRAPVWPAIVAALAAAAPVVVAGVRGAARGWTPTGDDAYSAVRAWDVFSGQLPLLGTWSSASIYTGHQINHPGPLQFDLLAVPVRLLGHGPGTAVGIALVNAAAVAAIAWLVNRRLGPAAATVAMAGSALLAWAIGSEILYDPWSQYAPLVPFSLFLVAVWAAAAGDRVALPILVVSGSYALQTHLSYAVLVPALTGFALAVAVQRARRRRRDDPAAWRASGRRSAWRWGAITLVTAALCWAQPVAEQIGGMAGEGEGNLAALFRSAGTDARHPTPGAAVRAFGGTVAVPPMWLPPSFRSPSFRLNGDGRPTWVAVTALAALAAALAVLGWRARRRGSSAVAAGALTALVALAAGFVTTLRMFIPYGMVATYSRFMWPLGMVVWVILAVAVQDEARARRSGRQPGGASDDPDDPEPRPSRSAAPWRLALPGLAVALVAGAAALPTVDNESATFPWTVEAIHAVDDDVLRALSGADAVLVEFEGHMSVGSVGPALFSVLQDAGIPFYVSNDALVRQLGTGRRYEPGRADVRIAVRSLGRAQPGWDERLVASWRGLSSAEAAELDRLTARVRRIVAAHGVPLAPGDEEYLDRTGRDELLDAVAGARRRPESVIDAGVLRELWSGSSALYIGRPLLDPEVFPRNLMERWADLVDERHEQTIRVYLSRL